jgi:tetratricopeptide (TPR) repeat protein
VALSRCTSLQGITLKAPIRKQDIFVRAEVVQFARLYNNPQLINQAMQEGKADREYRDAITAFDKGDFTAFLENFFKAIHSRYDIEKPVAQRYIRRKLGIINRQKAEIEKLQQEKKERDKKLKLLAAEYTLLGKECEEEQMIDAAIRNYTKALELCPNASEPKRRLKRLQGAKQ